MPEAFFKPEAKPGSVCCSLCAKIITDEYAEVGEEKKKVCRACKEEFNSQLQEAVKLATAGDLPGACQISRDLKTKGLPIPKPLEDLLESISKLPACSVCSKCIQGKYAQMGDVIICFACGKSVNADIKQAMELIGKEDFEGSAEICKRLQAMGIPLPDELLRASSNSTEKPGDLQRAETAPIEAPKAEAVKSPAGSGATAAKKLAKSKTGKTELPTKAAVKSKPSPKRPSVAKPNGSAPRPMPRATSSSVAPDAAGPVVVGQDAAGLETAVEATKTPQKLEATKTPQKLEATKTPQKQGAAVLRQVFKIKNLSDVREKYLSCHPNPVDSVLAVWTACVLILSLLYGEEKEAEPWSFWCGIPKLAEKRNEQLSVHIRLIEPWKDWFVFLTSSMEFSKTIFGVLDSVDHELLAKKLGQGDPLVAEIAKLLQIMEADNWENWGKASDKVSDNVDMVCIPNMVLAQWLDICVKPLL